MNRPEDAPEAAQAPRAPPDRAGATVGGIPVLALHRPGRGGNLGFNLRQ